MSGNRTSKINIMKHLCIHVQDILKNIPYFRQNELFLPGDLNMNTMNKKYGFVILIAVFVFASISGILYSSSKEEMQEQSRAAFKEAFEKEFTQRGAEGKLKYYVSRKSLLPPNNERKVVSVTDESGTKKYLIDPEKDAMNVTADPGIRGLHTALFRECPLHPDTLSNHWQRALKSKGVYAKTSLNIVVMERDQSNHQKMSRDAFLCAPRFHLFTFYIGYICEIEVSGFIDYTMLNVLVYNWSSFLILFLIVISATFILLFLLIKREKKEKEDVLPSIDVPIPTINEPMPTIEDPNARIYTISPDTIFNSVTQRFTIKGEENEKKLSGQLSVLLILFMEAENHEVADKVIMDKLWSDKTENALKLYSVIKRLRKELKLDPSVGITHIYPNIYKLTVS